MRRAIFVFVALLTMQMAQAKIHWGVRGGYSATTMTLSQDNWSTASRDGFFVGPTMKIGLPLGLGLDVSAIYEQRTLNSTQEDGYTTTEISNKRKSLALPLNLRYSIGLGDKLNVFAFVGPQVDLGLNDDIDETVFKWKWSQSTFSVNVGLGIMLLSHLEIRANYNIPCSKTCTVDFGSATTSTADGVRCRAGAWQVGASVYF